MLGPVIFRAGIAITAAGLLALLASHWGLSWRGVTAGYEWTISLWRGELVFTDSPIDLNPPRPSGTEPLVDAGVSIRWWLLRGRVGVTNVNGASCLSWIRLPLWTIPAAGAVLAVSSPVVWKKRSRRTAGQCKHCGYDQAGLASSAPCPECGADQRRA